MRVRFGPFILDDGTRQLLRDGSEIHLSTKAFDLLRLLIDQRPRVLEKSELLGHIWPDTFVVETNLNVLIGEIRRALADDARHPRFIRTVHGVGYAFSGDAPAVSAPAGPGSGSGRQTPCWLIGADRTFRLNEGENIIGRDPGSVVWLDAPSVSRRHARITVDSSARRAVLEDLKSTNGCLVRGVPIQGPTELADGDAITIGAIEMKAYLWNAAQAAETKRIPRKSS